MTDCINMESSKEADLAEDTVISIIIVYGIGGMHIYIYWRLYDDDPIVLYLGHDGFLKRRRKEGIVALRLLGCKRILYKPVQGMVWYGMVWYRASHTWTAAPPLSRHFLHRLHPPRLVCLRHHHYHRPRRPRRRLEQRPAGDTENAIRNEMIFSLRGCEIIIQNKAESEKVSEKLSVSQWFSDSVSQSVSQWASQWVRL